MIQYVVITIVQQILKATELPLLTPTSYTTPKQVK